VDVKEKTGLGAFSYQPGKVQVGKKKKKVEGRGGKDTLEGREPTN